MGFLSGRSTSVPLPCIPSEQGRCPADFESEDMECALHMLHKQPSLQPQPPLQKTGPQHRRRDSSINSHSSIPSSSDCNSRYFSSTSSLPLSSSQQSMFQLPIELRSASTQPSLLDFSGTFASPSQSNVNNESAAAGSCDGSVQGLADDHNAGGQNSSVIRAVSSFFNGSMFRGKGRHKNSGSASMPESPSVADALRPSFFRSKSPCEKQDAVQMKKSSSSMQDVRSHDPQKLGTARPSPNSTLEHLDSASSCSPSSAQQPLSVASSPTTISLSAVLFGRHNWLREWNEKLAAPAVPAPIPPASPVRGPSPAPTSPCPYPCSKLLAVSRSLPPRMHRQTWQMSDFAIVQKIYKGYASTVYKAFCKLSGEVVGLKVYHVDQLCELNRHQVYREVRLHSAMQHEHIIALYAAFETSADVVLVQEWAGGGDLFSLLQRHAGRMQEDYAVQLVLDPLLRVLQHLHSQGMVHRDLKPENILFTINNGLRLCDFGLAIDLREERAVTRAGTLDYMAPEVLACPYKNLPDENKEMASLAYSGSADAWAVGVLTYELLVGTPTFHDKLKSTTEERIRSDTPHFPAKMSEEACNFIKQALAKRAVDRSTISEMGNDSWIRHHRQKRSVQQLTHSLTTVGASKARAQNGSFSKAIAPAYHSQYSSPVQMVEQVVDVEGEEEEEDLLRNIKEAQLAARAAAGSTASFFVPSKPSGALPAPVIMVNQRSAFGATSSNPQVSVMSDSMHYLSATKASTSAQLPALNLGNKLASPVSPTGKTLAAGRMRRSSVVPI